MYITTFDFLYRAWRAFYTPSHTLLLSQFVVISIWSSPSHIHICRPRLFHLPLILSHIKCWMPVLFPARLSFFPYYLWPLWYRTGSSWRWYEVAVSIVRIIVYIYRLTDGWWLIVVFGIRIFVRFVIGIGHFHNFFSLSGTTSV